MQVVRRVEMKRNCFLFLVLAILLPILPAVADEVSLEPSQDAFVCDCQPSVTNPSLGNLYLAQGRYGACYNRTFIQWNLSSIPPGSVIESAEFWIYCGDFYGSPSGQMAYYTLIEEWNESTVTYSNAPDHDSDSGIYSTEWPVAQSWKITDVTDFVVDWFSGTTDNYGLHLTSVGCPSTSDCAFYSSRCSAPAGRPKLVVTFTGAALERTTWGGVKVLD